MISLANIEKPCGPNIEGLVDVELLPSSAVAYVPPTVLGEISGDILIYTGNVPVTWKFSDATFSDNRSNDPNHGDYYQPKLTIFTKKNSPELTHMRLATQNRNFCAIVTDKNGDRFFVKMLQCNDGASRNQKNGITWEFSGRAAKPSTTFNGIITPVNG